MPDTAAAAGFPRLTYLRIKNYRALRDVELRDLTPLTVLIGPNGSGKSTVLDALAFLAEAVSGNLQQAWEKRNRFAGMRTREIDESISFEVECFISDETPRLRYLLSIDEAGGTVFVSEEKLTEPGAPLERIIELVSTEPNPLQTPGYENIFRINIYERDGNEGRYYTSPSSDPIIYYTHISPIERADVAPKTLALTKVLASYRHIEFTDEHLKGYSDAGPREKLSSNGDNLPNVLYYLYTKHPEALVRISEKLRQWVPWLTDIVPEITSDERLLLRFRDAGFEKPMPTQYMSGGTMKLAVLLTLLYEPNATGLVGIEEPENELHPRLLLRVAEELVKATEMRQFLVATHSPFLIDALEPEQVWILHRGEAGYTQSIRLADMPDVVAMVEEGSKLGYLWARNFFDVGDPLAWFPTYRKQE
ncbi:AAA family ATPase [Hymenobacter sp. 102]|uniref:AAA family ATPase n=1 Tax=Hymenobacter sp. 102 TaxID=3403152 RepID=UPI003CF9F6A9